MGFWSGVWEGVKRFGGVVRNVAKKAWEFASGPSVSSTYDNLEQIIEKYESRKNRSRSPNDEPDFFGGLSSNKSVKKLEEIEKNILQQQENLEYAKRYMALQTEFSRLRGSAELIDRSMANIKIHAASLLTHFQNMRNINGLVSDVNTLRGGHVSLDKNI
jgi:hypothetical protein